MLYNKVWATYALIYSYEYSTLEVEIPDLIISTKRLIGLSVNCFESCFLN